MFGLSVTERITKKITKIPYISASDINKENYEKLMGLKSILAKGDNKYINKNNVTGIWYLTDKHYDENEFPQLIIRSSVKAGTEARIMLDHEVCAYAENENAYDFDNDVINENAFVDGLTQSLRDDILKGRVCAVYDVNRECI